MSNRHPGKSHQNHNQSRNNQNRRPHPNPGNNHPDSQPPYRDAYHDHYYPPYNESDVNRYHTSYPPQQPPHMYSAPPASRPIDPRDQRLPPADYHPGPHAQYPPSYYQPAPDAAPLYRGEQLPPALPPLPAPIVTNVPPLNKVFAPNNASQQISMPPIWLQSLLSQRTAQDENTWIIQQSQSMMEGAFMASALTSQLDPSIETSVPSSALLSSFQPDFVPAHVRDVRDLPVPPSYSAFPTLPVGLLHENVIPTGAIARSTGCISLLSEPSSAPTTQSVDSMGPIPIPATQTSHICPPPLLASSVPTSSRPIVTSATPITPSPTAAATARPQLPHRRGMHQRLMPPKAGQLSLLLYTRSSGSIGTGQAPASILQEQRVVTSPPTTTPGAAGSATMLDSTSDMLSPPPCVEFCQTSRHQIVGKGGYGSVQAGRMLAEMWPEEFHHTAISPVDVSPPDAATGGSPSADDRSSSDSLSVVPTSVPDAITHMNCMETTVQCAIKQVEQPPNRTLVSLSTLREANVPVTPGCLQLLQFSPALPHNSIQQQTATGLPLSIFDSYTVANSQERSHLAEYPSLIHLVPQSLALSTDKSPSIGGNDSQEQSAGVAVATTTAAATAAAVAPIVAPKRSLFGDAAADSSSDTEMGPNKSANSSMTALNTMTNSKSQNKQLNPAKLGFTQTLASWPFWQPPSSKPSHRRPQRSSTTHNNASPAFCSPAARLLFPESNRPAIQTASTSLQTLPNMTYSQILAYFPPWAQLQILPRTSQFSRISTAATSSSPSLPLSPNAPRLLYDLYSLTAQSLHTDQQPLLSAISTSRNIIHHGPTHPTTTTTTTTSQPSHLLPFIPFQVQSSQPKYPKFPFTQLSVWWALTQHHAYSSVQHTSRRSLLIPTHDDDSFPKLISDFVSAQAVTALLWHRLQCLLPMAPPPVPIRGFNIILNFPFYSSDISQALPDISRPGRYLPPDVASQNKSVAAAAVAAAAAQAKKAQTPSSSSSSSTPLSPVLAVQSTRPQSRILQQLMIAIAHLHARGILHRDLKPSNVLSAPNGKVILADFGLARLSSSPLSGINIPSCRNQPLPGAYRSVLRERLSSSYMNIMTPRMCTLYYRPPEMLLGQGHYGAGIDMWSVGCVWAELMLGWSLFGLRPHPACLPLLFNKEELDRVAKAVRNAKTAAQLTSSTANACLALEPTTTLSSAPSAVVASTEQAIVNSSSINDSLTTMTMSDTTTTATLYPDGGSSTAAKHVSFAATPPGSSQLAYSINLSTLIPQRPVGSHAEYLQALRYNKEPDVLANIAALRGKAWTDCESFPENDVVITLNSLKSTPSSAISLSPSPPTTPPTKIARFNDLPSVRPSLDSFSPQTSSLTLLTELPPQKQLIALSHLFDFVISSLHNNSRLFASLWQHDRQSEALCYVGPDALFRHESTVSTTQSSNSNPTTTTTTTTVQNSSEQLPRSTAIHISPGDYLHFIIPSSTPTLSNVRPDALCEKPVANNAAMVLLQSAMLSTTALSPTATHSVSLTSGSTANLPDWRLERLFSIAQPLITAEIPSDRRYYLTPAYLLSLLPVLVFSYRESNSQSSPLIHRLLFKILYYLDATYYRPHLESEQFDLLSWLLSYNQHSRPSALQAVLHPALYHINMTDVLSPRCQIDA